MKMCYFKTAILLVVLGMTTQLDAQYNNSTDLLGQDEVKTYTFALTGDPVGFLTFGPSINGEVAFSKNVSWLFGVRIPNMGLASQLYFEDLGFSYMGLTTLKFYVRPKTKADGFYFGPHLEYGKTTYPYSDYISRAFGGDIGYRWIFSNGFTLDISDSIGAIQSRPIGLDRSDEWTTDLFVFYLISVRLGISF